MVGNGDSLHALGFNKVNQLGYLSQTVEQRIMRVIMQVDEIATFERFAFLGYLRHRLIIAQKLRLSVVISWLC